MFGAAPVITSCKGVGWVSAFFKIFCDRKHGGSEGKGEGGVDWYFMKGHNVMVKTKL